MLADYCTTLVGGDGHTYHARAFCAPLADGQWEGWLEFMPDDTIVEMCISPPEVVLHPSRLDAISWASRLTPILLERALGRVLTSGSIDAAGASEISGVRNASKDAGKARRWRLQVPRNPKILKS
jgi:hypothetical protein